MRTTTNQRLTRDREVDLKTRRKGEAQRSAAEKGKTVGFYVKEIAKKAIKASARSR
jgi:hypothetical protein